MANYTTEELIKKNYEHTLLTRAKLVELEEETKSIKESIKDLQHSIQAIHDVIVHLNYKLNQLMEKKSDETEI